MNLIPKRRLGDVPTLFNTTVKNTINSVKTLTLDFANIKNVAITSAQIESLDAGKITTGYLSASRIQTGAITADKLSASYIVVGGAAGDVNAGITTINGGKITTGSVTTAQLNFTPVTGTNVIATINASAEGLDISADRIAISGATTFYSGYDPSTKIAPGGAAADVNANSTTINGGKITTNSLDANVIKTSSLTAAISVTTGQITAGGGTVVLDSSGQIIKGQTLTFQDSSGNAKGYLFGVLAGAFNLLAYTGVSLSLTGASGIVVSSDTAVTQFVAGGINMASGGYLDLPQRTSDPTAAAGRMYYCTSGLPNGYIRYYDNNAAAWKNIARV